MNGATDANHSSERSNQTVHANQVSATSAPTERHPVAVHDTLEPPQRNISLSSSADDALLDGELISMYSMDSSGFTVGAPRTTSSSPVLGGAAANAPSLPDASDPPPQTVVPKALVSQQATERSEPSKQTDVPIATNPERTSAPSDGSTGVAALTQVAERLETMTVVPDTDAPITVDLQQQQHNRPDLVHQRSMSENSETLDHSVQQLAMRQTPQHKGRFVVQPQSPVAPMPTNVLYEDASHNVSLGPLDPHVEYSQRMPQSTGKLTSSPSNKQPQIVIRQRSMPSNAQLAAEQLSIPPQPPPSRPPLDSTPADPASLVPDANGQIVTKKKGRFNFLEQAPSSRSASPGRMPEGETLTGQRHERSYSASAVTSAPSSHVSKEGATTAAPVVTKKGRFVVTSLPAPSAASQTVNPEPALGSAPSDSEPHSQEATGSAQVAPPNQAAYATTPEPLVTLPVLNGPGSSSGTPPLATTAPNRVSPVPLLPPGAHSVDPNAPLSHLQPPPFPASGDEVGPTSSFTSTSRGTITPRPTATRHGSSALNGQQGFGKMLYFLDQMKLEVTDADKNIKSLQTDMKCLKEKNKELEAKARDMERKWNQEKALREVAETRVKALKKRLKSLESNAESQITEDESVATHQTSGFHSRANSMDGGVDYADALVSNSSSLHIEASKLIASSESTGTLDTIDGSATSIAASRSTTLVRPSVDGSPPRDNIPKKKLVNPQSPITINAQGESNAVGAKSARSPVQPPGTASALQVAHESGKSEHGTYNTIMGPPPRPRTRQDSSGHSGPLQLASEFDPLRSIHHEPSLSESGSGPLFGPHLQASSTSSTSLFMDTHQYSGVSLYAEDSADLMDFQSGPSMQSTQRLQTEATLNTQSSASTPYMDHERMSSGSLVTMPYQDNPSTTMESDHNPESHGPTSTHTLQYPSGDRTDLFAEDEQVTDPFDELVQRRPTNGSQ